MKRNHYLLAIAMLTLVAVVGVSGCAVPGKVTGGGWIPSTSGVPGDTANFGFNAAQCVLPGPITGHFNYHDEDAPGFAPGGVKMNGPIVDAHLCDPQATTGPACIGACVDPSGIRGGRSFYEITVAYRSTNRNFPGVGVAGACFVDLGEGAGASPDLAEVIVLSGPYAGYVNGPVPVQGNIQAHACTCADGLDNNGNGLIDAADPSCIDPTTGRYDPNREEQ